MENKIEEMTQKQGGLEMEARRIMMEKMPVNNYPVSLATHEQVVMDRAIFMDTLKQFHAAMGSRLSYAFLFFDLNVLL